MLHQRMIGNLCWDADKITITERYLRGIDSPVRVSVAVTANDLDEVGISCGSLARTSRSWSSS